MGSLRATHGGVAAPARCGPQSTRPLRRLSSLAAWLGAALCCAACNGSPVSTGSPLRVVVFGDMPYVEADSPARDSLLARYAALLDTIAAQPASFVVHVGDITAVNCSDSLYAERRREFDALPHPLVFTPGDNDWLDCPPGEYDQLERLAKLRALFASGRHSLGGRTLALERQSEDVRYALFRENARWTMGGVLFLTVHVVGSNNGRGTGATPPAEYVARNAANLAWLRDSFEQARRAGRRGVAIFMHANLLESHSAGLPPAINGLRETLEQIRALAQEFAGPVALVHGDTHVFRVDRPLRDDAGNALRNVIRAETFGWPWMHAIVMTVEPEDPELFRFEPLLVRGNAAP